MKGEAAADKKGLGGIAVELTRSWEDLDNVEEVRWRENEGEEDDDGISIAWNEEKESKLDLLRPKKACDGCPLL